MRNPKLYYPLLISALFSLLLVSRDFLSFIIWWAAIFGIGLIFFPLTSAVFHRFESKGYIFSKTIGIGVAGYLTWLASS
ncbi:MAG: hypothetical protein LBC41_04605, partial [Clostridiales bacterium]|nr:hypothetical protein [Clostridiales bacterium]